MPPVTRFEISTLKLPHCNLGRRTMSEDKKVNVISSDGDPKKKIEELIAQLTLQANESNAAQGKQEHKEMGDHKFWKTQPVPEYNEEDAETDGPIDPAKTVAEVSTKPLPMLKSFEWVTLDLTKQEDLSDVHKLLYEHYVEDSSFTFRFNYTPEFFEWSLKPPGWKKQWHVGVRVKESGRLVAFISGVPLEAVVRGKHVKAVEINFLNIHKQLRSKRLAPVLIKEITRRVNLENIWQAFYTAGIVIPTPVSACRYAHRPLNWLKAKEVKFAHLPEGKTEAEMIKYYELPSTKPSIKGLRRAVPKDVDAIHKLYSAFHKRYELHQEYTKEEVAHWLLDTNSKIEDEKKKVVHCYVVENDSGEITDFFTFYILPFTVLDNPDHQQLNIAYLFYYASSVGVGHSRKDQKNQQLLAARLEELINDALILAKNLDMDIFNALTSQDNTLFLEPLKFAIGDGFLNYYFYNWRTAEIDGGFEKESKDLDPATGSGVGIVML